MKVVGLLSGGKDSCFNLCHCVKQGHEVIALASLKPEGGKEEIDSYLYQTVGQDGLHFIAEALELPLYRRAIEGTAVDQGSDYASTSTSRLQGRVEGDETEDLYELLKQVLVAHPEVQGVSVGAILSNYQRVRVEHVCARLGLQSLSYLWQYDQTQLLDDMAEAGMECIIIKVAGAGLGLRHLGQNVCSPEMRATLETLKTKWGTHPAGEGGEYETFTLDCPLFKKRIDLTKTEQVVLSDSDPRHDIGTVAYLRLQEAHLTDKAPSSCSESLEKLLVPPLLDQDAEEMYNALQVFDSIAEASTPNESCSKSGSAQEACTCFSGPWVAVGNIVSAAHSAEDQVKECFEALKQQLASVDLDLLSLAHINLYLSSMDLFPSVNAIYNTFFGPSPPTRACVACPLPTGCHVKMDTLAYRAQSTSDRTALHVRGLSYWAPANIGPYSQAVRVGERLFVAGQIGLIPPSLTLPQPDSLALEAALSSQHARRIVKAVQEGTGGGFTSAIESCICWLSGPSASFDRKLKAARTAWQSWQTSSSSSIQADVSILFVQVSSLPKGAQIEWQIVMSASQDDDNEDDDDGATSLPRRNSIAVTADSDPARKPEDNCGDQNRFYVRTFHTNDVAGDSACSTARAIFGTGISATSVPALNLATKNKQGIKMAFLAM
ncbi:adenine nucleotide alpha hydrolases-like protein [Cystobasidium minutum MCA 4210]|uniref:adenine nucleotide alpha hydrolases-like protein n=1 Tax=Cystobasidium minutum MCA 4210 TaxID=1397322 RepID=UPI0034CF6363|eukprot:jgi/Rhomi1/172375/fgenesh1_kg.5_\